MIKPKTYKNAGVPESGNSDWFNYEPNNEAMKNGAVVQARWVDGVREFRHRFGRSGGWINGAPWDVAA